MVVGDRAAGLPEAGAWPVGLRNRRGGDAAHQRERRRHARRPAGRIRGAKRLLTTAALIMSVFLITSSLVTTLLIPRSRIPARRGGQRPGFGLPGPRVPRQTHSAASMTRQPSRSCGLPAHPPWPGMLNLIPRYLPRYGMAPHWARAVRPLVLILTLVAFIITIIFDAERRCPGRRVRHRSPRPDHLGSGGGDARRTPTLGNADAPLPSVWSR